MADILVYGAGDDYTLELRTLLVDAGLMVDFRDIRGQAGTENRDFLITRGLRAIPQVFRPCGEHLGDYEAAVDRLSGEARGAAD